MSHVVEPVVFCITKLNKLSHEIDSIVWAYFLSALCGDDDVELVRAVDWWRESSCVLVVRVAYVRDDAVEHDVGVLRDRSDVARQAYEERHALSSRRRCSW